MTELSKIRSDTIAYRDLFLRDIPMMDVRAPVEFAKGSFPNAVNLSLMNDDERADVGTTYKEEGQDAAIAKGHALVGGAVKAARVATWRAFAVANPEGYLFCFRGGLRSQISQAWMEEAEVPYPRVTGGYKALRRFLIDETDRLVETRNFIVIAGRTGVGKTLLVQDIQKAIDLEGLANHRGSSFGRRIGDQPTQINFENRLAISLMKAADGYEGPIFLEDESRRIGGLELPHALSACIDKGPAVMVEESLEERISEIHKDYVADLLLEYIEARGDGGFEAFEEFLLSALFRVRKRLGQERYLVIDQMMRVALQKQSSQSDDSLHRDWIGALLQQYYDPMYDYQLSKKERPVVFRGSRAEVLEWQRSYHPA
ncbi:MAG: tRNA 2-selenouridine(34) synthase MnmH [Kordiimonadaceae bacterium]|nr:tRNA 2-selenouridine(34) synthase MnmH [Kordiimonadaceae bacterium]